MTLLEDLPLPFPLGFSGNFQEINPHFPLTSDGIVALGIELNFESLISAYENGVFPWPIEELPLPWFCPPRRAILEKERFHIPKSLKKALKKTHYNFTFNKNFSEVISACALAPRPDQLGTWITPEIQKAYTELHQRGRAYSVEVWNQNQLVGGLYGVDAGGVFAAESMFHTESNASKFAILFLVDHLFSKGLDWIDIQVLTPHMKALGARVIPRAQFLRKLKRTQSLGLKLF